MKTYIAPAYNSQQFNQYDFDNEELFLGKVGDFLKKAKDRVFRDLPKAVVNAVSAPFVKEAPFGIEDFQDKKYGAAATNEKNRKIVSVAGKVAITALTAGAGAGAVGAKNVFSAASVIGSAVDKKNADKEANELAAQEAAAIEAERIQQLKQSVDAAIQPTTTNTNKIIFAAIIVVLAIILIAFAR